MYNRGLKISMKFEHQRRRQSRRRSPLFLPRTRSYACTSDRSEANFAPLAGAHISTPLISHKQGSSRALHAESRILVILYQHLCC